MKTMDQHMEIMDRDYKKQVVETYYLGDRHV